MLRLGRFLCVAAVLFLTPSAPQACSLCGFQLKRTSFSYEWDRHELVVYGYAANSREIKEIGSPAGAGVTDFHIEKVLKGHAALGKQEVLQVDRYVPILDPKAPPKFVAFFDIVKGKPRFDFGRAVKSAAVLEYLDGARAYRDKDRIEALLFYSRYFDHPDEQIADDAFLEFARSTDREVGQAARKLAPERLRKLLATPKLEAERISLYAFLLGGCGGGKDAALLKNMLTQPGEETARATDGILGGYIALEPREGWDLAARILADPKKSLTQRYAVVRMVRLYHGWQPKESKKEIMRCYQGLIPDGELADFAIEDLRQWKAWDLTATILAQWDKNTHKAPIVRRSIARYALSCPTPDARRFIDRIRPQNREMLAELEEDLSLETNK